MAPGALALKCGRKETEGLPFGRQARISRKLWDELSPPLNTLIILYAPSRPPLSELTGQTFFAATYIEHVLPDPMNPTKVILHLHKPNFFPTIIRADHARLMAWGIQYFRDKSAEQKSLRVLGRDAYLQILHWSNWLESKAPDIAQEPVADIEFAEPGSPSEFLSFSEFDTSQNRERIPREVAARDRRNRKLVLKADRGQCVFTKNYWEHPIQDPLFEASHIMGVAGNGPDHPSNLLLASILAHKLFDNLGFTIRDDLTLLWADLPVLDQYREQFHADGKMHVNRPPAMMPSVASLAWHRNQFFNYHPHLAEG